MWEDRDERLEELTKSATVKGITHDASGEGGWRPALLLNAVEPTYSTDRKLRTKPIMGQNMETRAHWEWGKLAAEVRPLIAQAGRA